MTVTIFRTNVKNETIAKQLVSKLQILIPDFKINFDLEDCDKILRLCGNRDVSDLVIDRMEYNGYECTEITD